MYKKLKKYKLNIEPKSNSCKIENIYFSLVVLFLRLMSDDK